MAKMRASDVAMETTINALQVHGGAGYRKDLPWSGTSETQSSRPDL